MSAVEDRLRACPDCQGPTVFLPVEFDDDGWVIPAMLMCRSASCGWDREFTLGSVA